MRLSSCRSVVFVGLLSFIPNALSARLPYFRRATDSAHSTRLTFTNNADPFSFGVANTQGDGQTIYFVTLTVDGQDYAVVLDTGSADLWLDTTNVTFSSNVVNTTQSESLTYGDRSVAAGSILVGDVKIGDFDIGKQAFISAPGTNATSVGDQGLLGVGPPSLSKINAKLTNTTYNGAPLLQNLFSLYPNESNYITFMLNRSIFGVTDGGTFTVGEVDPDYSAITNATRLPVLTGSSQWLTAMDHVIVNGKNMSGHGMLDNTTATIPEAYQHKQLAMLDTGTALATGPQWYVDAIYGSVPNATLVEGTGGIYKLPCETKLNISMVFNGVEYPMNPLDAITVATDDDNVTVVCASTIAYSDPRLNSDWILGDAFLRNVYSLYDFGDMTNANDSAPFIQLLSLTDKEQAWANFDAANQNRIANYKSFVVDSQASTIATSSSTSAIATSVPTANVDAVKGFADTDNPIAQDNFNELMRNSWIIIGLLAGVVVLLIVLIVMHVLRGRQERKYSPLSHMGGPTYGSGKGSVYETPYDS